MNMLVGINQIYPGKEYGNTFGIEKVRPARAPIKEQDHSLTVFHRQVRAKDLREGLQPVAGF
jgi:hypothetical protein